MDFDVVVIGGGVTGCAIARYLSMYKLKLALFEAKEDVCSVTSKANSGIVHSGYDPMPGTLKARFNIRGQELIRQLSEELDFEYIQNGSLIISHKGEDSSALSALYERGVKNGVKGLRILNREEVFDMEKNLNVDVDKALYAPTGGIVCPFNLTLALGENAKENGCAFYFNKTVIGLKRKDGYYEIGFSDDTNITCKAVVNAAGLYADVIHNMVSNNKYTIIPRRGNYLLFDKAVGDYVKHTIFQLPKKVGKGVLVTPTVHGNLLAGPTNELSLDKEDTFTYHGDMNYIKENALKSVVSLPFDKVITNFSGLRAHLESGDFVVGECPDSPNFFDALGIESPGLTSAPAIGEYLASLLASKLNLILDPEFRPRRKGIVNLSKLSMDARREKIKENPLYAHIVCRCEEVSEGEIIDAINSPLGARSLDGIKRRVRAGMGRCQAGFCSFNTMKILSRELDLKIEDVNKNSEGSRVLYEA